MVTTVLISGAGIAGPTLAWWLLRHGCVPTLVERATKLRSDGYVIDFCGTGYEVAERMGLMPEIKSSGYDVREVRMVDASGRRCGGFSAEVFRSVTQGRYTSIARGDLAAAIYRSIERHVETLFGDHITAIAPDDSGVRVAFAHASERRFDLVIGADGLHSVVHRLAFGSQDRFEKHLGYNVAAFDVVGYRPRDEGVYLGYAIPGKQVVRFSKRDDRTMFLFVFAADRAPTNGGSDFDACRHVLHAQFDEAGWECAPILEAMDRCGDIYFDRVSQIRMDAWSKRRVALVGDAAFCPSLLAGEGSALAMTAAYVLAGELGAANGDPTRAFAAYERRLRPFILGKQREAEHFAGAFAPRTRLGLFVRNLVSRAFAIPAVARYVVGRSMVDGFLLDYADPKRNRPHRGSRCSGDWEPRAPLLP